jgi:hypothetical protein
MYEVLEGEFVESRHGFGAEVDEGGNRGYKLGDDNSFSHVDNINANSSLNDLEQNDISYEGLARRCEVLSRSSPNDPDVARKAKAEKGLAQRVT